MIRQKSLSGFYAISKRKHCMTFQFLNLDTLHQRLRIHSYVTGCTTERVWGGGEGPLIIAFSSWPGLLVLNMCIVRLYLKTFWNHQTVFIFTFVSMKFSDNSTGTFNQKLTCWRIKLEAKDWSASRALICISSFTGIILLRKYLSALFLFFPSMIPFLVRPAWRTRGFAQYPKFSYPPKIQVSKISNPTTSFKSPPSPEISSS